MNRARFCHTLEVDGVGVVMKKGLDVLNFAEFKWKRSIGRKDAGPFTSGSIC